MKCIFKNTAILFLVWIPFYNQAQNLVPNPSFEEYKDLFCGPVSKKDDFNNAVVDWFMPTAGTTDINSTLIDSSICANHPLTTLEPALGKQRPRTGNFTVAMILFSGRATGECHDYKEYIEVELPKPLIPNEIYYGEFWVSLAENSKYASNNLGMLISDEKIVSNQCYPIVFEPQINATNIITDTEKWIRVSGFFEVKKQSSFLLIGNFFNDANTLAIETGKMNPAVNYDYAYYYIDDVLIEKVSLKIPNVFTPNRDGINDTFVIEGLAPESDSWDLEVYNRYGDKVLQACSYKMIGMQMGSLPEYTIMF